MIILTTRGERECVQVAPLLSIKLLYVCVCAKVVARSRRAISQNPQSYTHSSRPSAAERRRAAVLPKDTTKPHTKLGEKSVHSSLWWRVVRERGYKRYDDDERVGPARVDVRIYRRWCAESTFYFVGREEDNKDVGVDQVNATTQRIIPGKYPPSTNHQGIQQGQTNIHRHTHTTILPWRARRSALSLRAHTKKQSLSRSLALCVCVAAPSVVGRRSASCLRYRVRGLSLNSTQEKSVWDSRATPRICVFFLIFFLKKKNNDNKTVAGWIFCCFYQVRRRRRKRNWVWCLLLVRGGGRARLCVLSNNII